METKDIYVFIEQRDGELLDVGFELLNEARNLVSQIKHVDFDVVGVLLGNNLESKISTVFKYGADKVIYCDGKEFERYSTHHYSEALNQIIEQYHPDAFLIGASILGRDLAPRVAAKAHTGLTADATKLEIDPEEENSTLLWITRPAFGGNLFGTIICPDTRPQMATVRPNVFEKSEYTESKEVTEYFTYNKVSEDPVEFLAKLNKEEKAIDLTKANIILSVGRGLAKDFDVMQDLAKEIGAQIATSRALVDMGVSTKEMQVGQTGSTVRPNVYIACGISGAVQHTAGMDKSELIIAINTDPQAAIFQVADLGIVGDAKEVLPLLKNEILRLQRK